MSTWRAAWALMRFRPWLSPVNLLWWLVFFGIPLLTGLILREVFDTLAGSAQAGLGIWALLALLIAVEALRVLSTYGRILGDIAIEFNVSALLRRNLLEQVLHHPGARALPASPGEAVSRFRDDVGQIADALAWPSMALGEFLLGVVAFVVMLRIDALITLVVLLPMMGSSPPPKRPPPGPSATAEPAAMRPAA